MGKHAQRALKKAALGGSIGPAPKSHKITGEFRDPGERPHGQPWLRPWYASPRKIEEAIGTRREDDGPPIIPRVHSIARRADGGKVDHLDRVLLAAMRGIEGMGAADTPTKLYNDVVQRGRREPITERDFEPDELAALREVVHRKGGSKGHIDYPDYQGSSNAPVNALGGFDYEMDPQGGIDITDRYDFNTDRAPPYEDNLAYRLARMLLVPRDAAASIGRRVVPPGTGPDVRLRIPAEHADGGSVDEFEGMSPVDALRLRTELVDIGRANQTEEEKQANARRTREALLDATPIIGNIRSAQSAKESGSRMVRKIKSGELKAALKAAGLFGLDVLGANMGVSASRGAGRGMAKDASRTANIFAGPTAKTADHTALARAQEMKAAGADRADIWRETGWFQGAEGKWRFEIPDNDARLSDVSKDVLDPAGKISRSERPARQLFEHPDLDAAYPSVLDSPMSIERGRGSAAFYDNSGRIDLQPRNVHEGKSIGLHELQHRIQRDEGFAPGGNRSMGADYRRSAGEVEARNVETRQHFDPESRRESPPWETQDVPENEVLVNGLLPGSPQEVFVPAQPSKTADLAYEMRGNDVPNRQIFKETNRFFTPSGRLAAEVPDKPMVIKRQGMQEGDTAPMSDLIDHPALFGVHPELRDIPVTFGAHGDYRGHPVARLRREGGVEVSSGRDDPFYREQFAKLLNYQTAEKGGFGGAVLHDVRDQFKAYDDALRMAEDIVANPKPGDDVAAALAYIERLRPMHQKLDEGLDAQAAVRNIRINGPDGMEGAMEIARNKGITEDATRAGNRHTVGNLESRLVRMRSQRDIGGRTGLDRYPYEQGVRIGEVGPNWSKAQVLPHRDMDRDAAAALISDWHKFGIGNPRKFANGGRARRVERALRKAGSVTVGAVSGKTPGRADALKVRVPAGSYVIPADVVAALGEGNSAAGLAKLSKQFPAKRANGGAVPIMISDGEFVVSPQAIAALGGGDQAYGHDILDRFVVNTRREYAEHLNNLPGPNQ